jgi:threonine/homoserine/homoserine lactone efflux protein
MHLDLWWRGVLIGLTIAVPVGPIALMTIQRTLNHGRVIGLATGLGAATADLVYGSIAAFGLTLISGFLIDHKAWFSVIGGLFLCYLGARTLLTAPATKAASVRQNGILGAYTSSFFLTLTNPPTILFFLAIFAGFGLAREGLNYTAAMSMVAGVFSGSAAWWLTLSYSVGLLRTRFNQTTLGWANKIAGVTICIFGIVILGSLWR